MFINFLGSITAEMFLNCLQLYMYINFLGSITTYVH